MKQTVQPKNVLKQIFHEHWERFKQFYPSYNRDQYNCPVAKMLVLSEIFRKTRYRILPRFFTQLEQGKYEMEFYQFLH